MDCKQVNGEIERARREGIMDHHLFRRVRMSELPTQREVGKKWREHLMPNHEITIEIKIKEITPIIKSRDTNPNQLTFDSLRFHLHHADQSTTSPIIQYHPRHNIYRQGDLIQGKMIRDDRSITLKLRHEIRHQNLQLYRGLFKEMPIKVVAEASYGLILGIADIYIEEIVPPGQEIKDEFRCIIFNLPEYDQTGELISNTPVLYAKTSITIDSSPIAPLLQDLKINAQTQLKKRPTSKSKSPNRLISTSPSKIISPKKKRLLITELSSPQAENTHLTIFQGVEYRYKLGTAPTKREITYRQAKNIKQRKVELVKIEEEYYLKCCLWRDNAAQRGYIHFELNQRRFMAYAITDSLFGVVDYQTYFRVKEKKGVFFNKLVRIGGRTLVYPRQATRIIKNFVKQSTTDGLLSSIFLKTPFDQCQIYTQAPFFMEDIAHKQGGYMIGYYHFAPQALAREEQGTLVFFLKSRFKQINEIHVFECTIVPRVAGRDTVYKQLHINKGEAFCKISLELMANEKLEYQIRSTFLGVTVVNGQNYQFSSHNPDLILQVMQGYVLQSGMEFDVVFTDSKLRCFFMRVTINMEEEGQEDALQKDKEEQ